VFDNFMNDFDSDDLAAKLRSWKVEPKTPASFQRAVWQRIAARQAAREDALGPRVARWLSTQFVRPRYALALVSLSLCFSIGAGLLHAQGTNIRHWKALEARYASSIDPIEMGR
jgi:hypothetical protein